MPPATHGATSGALCAIAQQPQWNLENAHHDEFAHADTARSIGAADAGATQRQAAADRSSHQASVNTDAGQADAAQAAGRADAGTG
jgi:hypothetical protein